MKPPPLKTGIDQVLNLEAVYYPTQIPRHLAVLTILGVVFDKVYFPGVYLPRGGFDQLELDKEIARIEGLPGPTGRSDRLLPILHFVRHARTLDNFCIFTGDPKKRFSDDIPGRMVKDLYEAIHGPSPPNWHPTFATNYVKGMPGSDEHVAYPDDYHYLAGALIYSAQEKIPLLNDVPGLPIPGLEESSPHNHAKVLSAILAIECAKLVMPAMPVLRPLDLMEFRAENVDTLRAFRRSMLAYVKDLNGRIKGAGPEELQSATKFFVQTEIVPILDQLRSSINAPARPWYKRAIDFARVIPELGTAFITLDPATAVSKVLTTYAGQFFAELTAKGEQREALKRSGLYYLLRLEAFQSDRPEDP